MTDIYDPNANDDVEPPKADESAALGLVSMKLEGILATLPEIAANQHTRQELFKLQNEVRGHHNRIRGEIQQQRRAGLPD